MEEIKVGDVFEHLEAKELVVVVCLGAMKVEEGPWYSSVTYRVPTGRVYTRASVAFLEKFKKL